MVRFEDVPVLYREAYKKALTVKVPASAACKAKCLECTGFQRKEVTLCTVKSCPLWLRRPYTSGLKKTAEREVADLMADGMPKAAEVIRKTFLS